MARPTIKTKIQLEKDVENIGIDTVKDGIKNSLHAIQFPSGFETAFGIYSENLSRDVRDRNTRRPVAQMAFDSAALREYLRRWESVIVTVGQDDDSHCKIAFQGMKISSTGKVTLDTTGVLSNFEDADGSTFPLHGFPTP
jgi:hypothetical protein